MYIFVDSQAAIQRLNQPLNNHITKKARQYAKALAQLGIEVTIQWCPSHASIFGNEQADELAKKGLSATRSPEAYTSISFLKRQLKELDVENWKTNWENSNKGKGQLYSSIALSSMKFSRKPYILEVPRKNQGAYIQLKTGVGYLKPYFFKIGRASDGRCFGNCNSKQDTRHLILECKNYKKERKKVQKRLALPLSLQLLFNTNKGKEALAEYLIETGVATADWYTNAGRIEA